MLRLNQTTGRSGKGAQERLLDAGEVLFSDRGFGGTHIRDLAAATLYRFHRRFV
jgi:AcrR family transcriptional regulator